MRQLVPAVLLFSHGAFPFLLGCAVSKSKYELALSERDACRLQVEQCEAEKEGLGQKHRNLLLSLQQFEKNHQDLLDQLAALHSENEDLSKRIRSLQEQTKKIKERDQEEASQAYKEFLGSLSSEISQGKVRIDQLEKGLRLNLVGKILFPSGSADLSPKGEEILEKVGFVLKDIRDRKILIEGHADNVPIHAGPQSRFPSNWELSAARAAAVARFFEEKVGIDPRLLSATGYSSYQPAFDNSTPEGRQANRRIEILLLPLTPSEIQSLYGSAPYPSPMAAPPAKGTSPYGQGNSESLVGNDRTVESPPDQGKESRAGTPDP